MVRACFLLVLLSVWCATASAGAPQFSEAEREWIRQHPVVYYAGAPDISPLEDIVDGRYRGLIAAYLDTVAKRTGIRFQLVPAQSWQASQDAFLAGKVDLFPNANPTTVRPEVQRELRYTQAYFASPLIFVTRGDAGSTFNITSLDGKRVAIRGGPDVQKILTDRRPGVIPLEVGSPEASLRAVIDGRADASVGTEATLLPLLRRRYGDQLGVASMLDLPPYRAQMGVRASEPILFSILEKALGSITAHESDVLYERHLTQADYGAPTLWSILHYRRIEILLATLGMLVLAFFAWRTRLASQRAVRSERTKARFLATMSHEIRTPLNAMLGSIELLGRTRLDARQQTFTRAAAESAEALMDLLDNVLDLSKLDAGKLTLERLPVDLAKLIEDACALVRPHAQAKGLSVDMQVDLPAADRLLLDPTRVRQILNNLLGNAVKFTHAGRISVAASVRGLPGASDAHLDVRVADTGIGIAPEQQAQLFKAYAQADDSTTREFGGTGLGLTICRELVEMMGGAISLESTPGGGTAVSFRLPVERITPSPDSIAAVATLPQPAAAEVDIVDASFVDPPARGSVLVVEDHPGNRALIHQQLLELGVEPTMATSGAEALQLLKERSFDLVLMDCHMPVMDGYETTRRIRARPTPSMHLPIVAISASTGAEHLAACLDCGMDGVLRKPLRLEELRSTLELWPVNMAEPSADAVVSPSPPTDHPALLREDHIALVAAVTAGDLPLARHHAHRLRGAALMLDLGPLAAAAEHVETTLHGGNLPDPARLTALGSLIPPAPAPAPCPPPEHLT
ncbi:ATP-binding protein [Stenotrophomonas sp. PD6]|uniref:ATP-binding protein n=1 Tax=Stenotrophomonas sp. PD6 TaxID=3368612 RepID=UPI003B9FF6AF